MPHVYDLKFNFELILCGTSKSVNVTNFMHWQCIKKLAYAKYEFLSKFGGKYMYFIIAMTESHIDW